MNIPINQDIETAYRNEFVKGFSLYEFGFAFGGIVAIAFVTFIAWWKFGISPAVGVYMGFPFAIPFFFCVIVFIRTDCVAITGNSLARILSDFSQD